MSVSLYVCVHKTQTTSTTTPHQPYHTKPNQTTTHHTKHTTPPHHTNHTDQTNHTTLPTPPHHINRHTTTPPPHQPHQKHLTTQHYHNTQTSRCNVEATGRILGYSGRLGVLRVDFTNARVLLLLVSLLVLPCYCWCCLWCGGVVR